MSVSASVYRCVWRRRTNERTNESRYHERDEMADSQYGQLRESMPPPPRRRNQQDLSEDSRLGRAEGQEKESSALVSGGVSGVPTGFFDGADTPVGIDLDRRALARRSP